MLPSEETINTVRPLEGNSLSFTYEKINYSDKEHTTIYWTMSKKEVRTLVEDWIAHLPSKDRRALLSDLLVKELF